MAELITQLVAVLGSLALLAKKLFDAGKDQNDTLSEQNKALVRLEKNMSRLLERNGMESWAPPEATTRRYRGRLLPRKATPLPFSPVPEAIEREDSDLITRAKE